MAKVRGPLHSVSASGSIGGTLTMLTSLGVHIAKKKASPGGAATAAQIARRDLYRSAAAAWMAKSPAEKAAYQARADANRITAFNAYLKDALKPVAPVAGISWDGGAAVWDGGAAVWS